MKRFDYEVAINQLKLGKEKQLNTEIRYDRTVLCSHIVHYIIIPYNRKFVKNPNS